VTGQCRYGRENKGKEEREAEQQRSSYILKRPASSDKSAKLAGGNPQVSLYSLIDGHIVHILRGGYERT
jgi:hypothetical protein